MKPKTKQLISLFLVELIILLPIAFVDAMTISNVRQEDITQNTAKIKWDTDQLARERVNYGLTEQLGQTAATGNQRLQHEVQLTNLAPDTQYYYEVISSNSTDTINDNNSDNFYTLTTLPITPLFVNASLPQYHKSHSIDVEGNSIRLARIELKVDNGPPQVTYADESGYYRFLNINLVEGNNTMHLRAQSQSITTETTYELIVDSTPPRVTISYIPEIIGGESIRINGTVSEQVEISFFVNSAEPDTTAPPQVRNLTNETVQANRIEISWAEVDVIDFGKYIIYRDNKPLYSTDKVNYNDYTDVLVNSNQTYRYAIAAIDQRGNLGPRSSTIIVRTSDGGRTDIPEPPEIDIFEDINTPQETITTDNEFDEDIEIGEEDGFYTIKIVATDIAGNKVTLPQAGGKTILLDTEPPEIEIISPKPGGTEIFENYADSVTIRGQTEPGARVYLYVQRTPFGTFNRTADISGLPDEIQDMDEQKLRADCNFVVEGKDHCKTHADYDEIANAQGYFEFEDIDLTSMWAGALNIRRVESWEDFEDLEQEDIDQIESNLIFIAVDGAGRKGAELAEYEIVDCWSSDFKWDVTPLIEYQSPTFLNVERLKEGTETIYFYFNFTYHKQNDDDTAKVTDLTIRDACGKGYLERQERYNYSCSILGSCTEKINPTGTTAYVACPLRRLEGIEQWTDDEWESFLDAMHNEMAFPLKLTMSYEEIYANETRSNRKEHEICTEVSYVVDATMINPKELLPDWLLYDLVDWLNTSIEFLDEWVEKISQILEWAAIACSVTFLLKFVTQFWRRATCHYDRIFKKLEQLATDEEKNACRECVEQNSANEHEKALERLDAKEDIQDIVSNKCLTECYSTCAAAWSSEQSLYQTYRWACDRVFGHSSPSKWTENKNDAKLFQKKSEGKGCSNDQSVRGRPLRAVDCKTLETKYRIQGQFGRDDKCLEITTHDSGRPAETLYHITGPYQPGSKLYKVEAQAQTGVGPRLEYEVVIQQNENNYLGPMEQTCEQLCKGELTNKRVDLNEVRMDGKTFTLETDATVEDLDKKQKTDAAPDEEKKPKMVAMCKTPNECVSYETGDQRTITLGSGKQLVDVDVQSAIPMGFTRNCWDPFADPAYVSNDPDKRIECCCINAQPDSFPLFYKASDVEDKQGEFGNSDLEEMGWSYRYWKIVFKGKTYNPDRYIEGRDKSACLGQNNWVYDGFSTKATDETGNMMIMDPSKQWTSAFQCIAISQIMNRLKEILNFMNLLRNCLIEIRTTGRADAGVCKEIFTQYVCSFIWKIITWLRNGCLPFGSGINLAESDSEILEAFSVGMGGMWDTVVDSQQELASEYGNAQLNNLLGVGEEDIFRKVCLFAFGYDWELDFESIIDVAYQAPFATFVHPVLPSREFLTFDPENAQSKYEYRSGWVINPGCDLEGYEVKLACVTRNDMYDNSDINCAKQQDPYGRNCDCLELNEMKTTHFYSEGDNIKQNEMREVDSSQIDSRIKTSPYRYDHLMFRLRVDREYLRDRGDVSKCFPDGHEDGIFFFPITDYTAREIAGCHLDAATQGTFSCRGGADFFNTLGLATIDGIDLDDDNIFDDHILQGKPYASTYYAGQPIQGKVKYSKDEKTQCLIVRLLNQNMQQFASGDRSLSKPYKLTGARGGDVVRFDTGYEIDPDDILVNRGTVQVQPEEEWTGRPGMIKVDRDRTSKPGGTFRIKFIDENSDSKGDIYEAISGDVVPSTGTTGPGQTVWLGGFSVEFVNPDTPPGGDHTYTIIATPEPTDTQQGITTWYLHLDLRNPVDEEDCDRAKESNYDSSNIIVSDGRPQSYNIPIRVAAETVNEEQRCRSNSNTQQLIPEEECICGNGREKNCPTDATGHTYCVDNRCRKYPQCADGIQNTQPCVCGSLNDLDRFNCAFPSASTSQQADFKEGGKPQDREYSYCIRKRCVKESTDIPSELAPLILVEDSRIEETDASGNTAPVFLRPTSFITVESRFNVEIRVDGRGSPVDRVIVSAEEDVALTQNGNVWTGQIELTRARTGEEIRIEIEAEGNGRKSEKVRQRIKVIGIAE